MVYIVLGFHKSGTTLVARTLHEFGIDMAPPKTGEYPSAKYEDRRVQAINKAILYNGQNRKSYQLPWSYNDQSAWIRRYVDERENESAGGDWGFKVPDITLCYPMWKPLLPPHKVIGVRRCPEGVINHYMKRSTPPDYDVLRFAMHVYNTMMEGYGCPIVHFEDILGFGPAVIEDALGIAPLPDVRRERV